MGIKIEKKAGKAPRLSRYLGVVVGLLCGLGSITALGVIQWELVLLYPDECRAASAVLVIIGLFSILWVGMATMDLSDISSEGIA